MSLILQFYFYFKVLTTIQFRIDKEADIFWGFFVRAYTNTSAMVRLKSNRHAQHWNTRRAIARQLADDCCSLKTEK
jgi:hypothetical protein